MDRLKVLQFPVSRNIQGGITRYAIQNYKHIDKSRFVFDFGTLNHVPGFAEEVRSIGGKVRYISCYAEENERQFIKEMRALLLDGYDVVHLHTSRWKSFLVEQLARECGIPKIIVHAHSSGIDIQDEIAHREAERLHNIRKQQFNTSFATDFCACSWKAADFLFGPQIPRDRIRILRNAIEVEPFLFNPEIRSPCRRELGVDGCFVIGNVGRLAYPKNQEFLVRVFAHVSKRVKNARLLLVGDGPLDQTLRNQVRGLNLTDRVLFTGNRSDVNKLLQAMDVFCLPSRFEGLPIALVEAQASGLKCLASDQVTPEVEITDCVERLPLDAELWAERLAELSRGYERKDRCDELTEKGFNLEREIKKIEALYSER